MVDQRKGSLGGDRVVTDSAKSKDNEAVTGEGFPDHRFLVAELQKKCTEL